MAAGENHVANALAIGNRTTRTRRVIVRSRWRVWTSVACAALAAVAVTPVSPRAEESLPTAAPESIGMSSKRLERINAFIRNYIDTNQIAGAVTLVARKGKVVHFEAQGWRHKEEKLPMEKDTIFSLASI